MFAVRVYVEAQLLGIVFRVTVRLHVDCTEFLDFMGNF